jgi:hypothetical protein
MCCFDGTSVEGNRIMFCDGCNAAVHQACYGVTDIPEGDFFCDRCRGIQVLAEDDEDFDIDNARDAIKCCFCPMYHGGIKPTTDGRWIHLCCAIWSGESSILGIQFLVILVILFCHLFIFLIDILMYLFLFVHAILFFLLIFSCTYAFLSMPYGSAILLYYVFIF